MQNVRREGRTIEGDGAAGDGEVDAGLEDRIPARAAVDANPRRRRV